MHLLPEARRELSGSRVWDCPKRWAHKQVSSWPRVAGEPNPPLGLRGVGRVDAACP